MEIAFAYSQLDLRNSLFVSRNGKMKNLGGSEFATQQASDCLISGASSFLVPSDCILITEKVANGASWVFTQVFVNEMS